MNRSAVLGALVVLSILLVAGRSEAAPSKDESNLTRETARLDRTASTPSGEAAVIKRMRSDFGVDGDRIAALRAKGMGFGEVAIVLSLAQKVQGGITEGNIERVTALRNGPPARGWGEVAKQLGVRLGAAVSQVRKVQNEARREMKTDHEAGQPQTGTEPPAPTAEPKKARTYSGEGKDMTRGSAAK